MKQSTLATKLMMSILVLGILIYLAAYAVRGWREELVTTPAYAAVQDSTRLVHASGLQ